MLPFAPMQIDDEMEVVLRQRAKVVLRQRARALRNTIPPGAIAERSRRIVATLGERLQALGARSVALFDPIEGRNEVDLRALDVSLRARDVRVAYPSIDPETRVMTFRFVADPAALVDLGLGFREPPRGEHEASSLDVIVVPALQLDPRGHRIGYGAGYYDRTLPKFAPPAVAIGVCFDFQLVADVPALDHDARVGEVVTDAKHLVATMP